MELRTEAIIKIVDKSIIFDKEAKKDIVLWKNYIAGADGHVLTIWTKEDWSQYVDIPSLIIFAIGNKGRGFWVRILDIFPSKDGISKKRA